MGGATWQHPHLIRHGVPPATAHSACAYIKLARPDRNTLNTTQGADKGMCNQHTQIICSSLSVGLLGTLVPFFQSNELLQNAAALHAPELCLCTT